MSPSLGGYKGMGEGGAIASPPAVANAVNDALAQIGVPPLTVFPFDRNQILAAINAADGDPACWASSTARSTSSTTSAIAPPWQPRPGGL